MTKKNDGQQVPVNSTKLAYEGKVYKIKRGPDVALNLNLENGKFIGFDIIIGDKVECFSAGDMKNPGMVLVDLADAALAADTIVNEGHNYPLPPAGPRPSTPALPAPKQVSFKSFVTNVILSAMLITAIFMAVVIARLATGSL